MTVRCNRLLADWHTVKRRAHMFQLDLLLRTQEQNVEMHILPEDIRESRSD
jgi:hypothetical protein